MQKLDTPEKHLTFKKSSLFKKFNSKKIPILQLRFPAIIVLVITMVAILLPEREQKRDREIEGIKAKQRKQEICAQYALIASESGWFPCYNCAGNIAIYLYEGEIWKYGKTCNGQEGRYPSGMPCENLQYIVQFTGTEQECLIEEKRKIYNYPALPECLKRNIVLIRPPGNKIDR